MINWLMLSIWIHLLQNYRCDTAGNLTMVNFGQICLDIGKI